MYPKIDLPYYGKLFHMAFLFLPTGPVIYTGSLHSIRTAASALPTCHGLVLAYKGHKDKSKKAVVKSFEIFGVDGGQFLLKQRNSSVNCGQWNSIKGTKRPNYALFEFRDSSKYNNTLSLVLIGTWRKMPSTYLKQFNKARLIQADDPRKPIIVSVRGASVKFNDLKPAYQELVVASLNGQ
jgi:hypothetical protein